MTETDIINAVLERAGADTKKEFAERAGVSPTALGNWLSGSRLPGIEVLHRVAEAHGLRLDIEVRAKADPAPTVLDSWERELVSLVRRLRATDPETAERVEPNLIRQVDAWLSDAASTSGARTKIVRRT